MRLVYISSPLRGDVERNIQRARDYCAYAASCGVIPLAPHTIFTQYLDDEQPEQREQGLRMGRDLMWRCDDLWVVGSTISSGMREEIELAKKLYMPIFYVPEDMEQEHLLSQRAGGLCGKPAGWAVHSLGAQGLLRYRKAGKSGRMDRG